MKDRSDNQKTVKTAFLNTIANGLALVVGMVMIPIIARVLTEEELGVAVTFLGYRNILVIIVTLAVYAYVNKAMLEYRDDKKNYLLSVSVFCMGMVLAAFAVTWHWRQRLSEILGGTFLYHWLFVSILALALYSMAQNYNVFHNHAMLVFVVVLTTGPVAQFLSVGLALMMPDKKYIGRVIGLDAVYVIVAVVFLLWLVSSRKKRIKGEYIRESLKFSVPLIPHLLSQNVLTQCDLIMISYYIGSGESGIYSMAHTIGFLALTVMSQIIAAWSPWVYRRLEEDNRAEIRDKSALVLLLGSYISIGLMTVAPELVKLFLTPAYLPCIYIIPVLVAAMFFQFIYIFFYDVEYYYKKSHWIAIASVAAAAVNLALNALLIPQLGYMAACYTTLAGYLVLLLANYRFAGRLAVREVYPLGKFAAACLAVVAYMAFSLMFADALFIRYGVLVVVTAILAKREWKNLIPMVTSMFKRT